MGTTYFSSASEILSTDDRVQTDIHFEGWGEKSMRIQALSFDDMEYINNMATNAEGNIDSKLYHYYTIIRGVIIPKFNLEQVKQLDEKNGYLVRELVQSIWQLGRVSKKAWDAYINALNEQSEIDEQEHAQTRKK
jgi:hypothetical protein